MKRFLLSLLVIVFGCFNASAQGYFCSQATSIVTGSLNTYPAGVNSGTAEAGPQYGCLGSQPNPVWYYLHIGTSGTIDIEMHSTPQNDIDFACWGPFTDPVSPCTAQLTSSTLTGCSYSSSWQELCNLPNALSGQYYLLLITNYSNMPCNIIFGQTGGTGSLIYASCISGNVYNDVNGNGVKDTGEISLGGRKVKLLSTNIVHLTQNDGNYYFACDSGTQQVQYLPNNYWDITTDSIISVYIPDSITHIGNNDFGTKLQDSSSDVSIDITGNAAQIIGSSHYWLTYKNEAALPKSGSVVLTIDTLTTFVNSTPPPDTQNGNILTWNYANLLSLETRQIFFSLQMPGFNYLGDTIETTAKIDPILGDMYVPNNFDTLRQRIVGSFDPNDKIVDKGIGVEGYTLFGEELEYTIRFQNTGNAGADLVRIVDTIDNNLDMASFCLIAASHSVSVEMADSNYIIFSFQNIQLPDSGTNLSASNGFVKFGMKPKSGLAENTPVTNSASIFFDLNPAVVTNQTLNTFVSSFPVTVNVTNISDDKTIGIFPNPSSGNINIAFAESIKCSKINVLNSWGQIVLSKEINNQAFTTLDLSNKAKGIYIIKVESGNGVVLKKVIVE